MSNYLFNAIPVSVFCTASNLNCSPSHEDSATILLEYSNGRVSNITANWATSRKVRKLTALSNERFFELDYMAKSVSMFSGENNSNVIPTKYTDFNITNTVISLDE